MSFTIATTVDEALAAMAAGARPIAGGTDLVVGARHGKAPLPTDLVAIDRIAELGAVTREDDDLVIGAMVTHGELMVDPDVVADATALADAAALVGSPATRHVGTLGGNLMNGSPAMDTGAPLVVLDAEVELRSAAGGRTLPVGDLWTGPGATTARADELCTRVRVPRSQAGVGSAYVRLEVRRAMEIAVVGAAACVRLDEHQRVASVAVALTAVAPTIIAVPGLDSVTGGEVGEVAAAVQARATEAARPISDLRAGADYRRHTVGVMARRAVEAAAQRAAGVSIAIPVNRTLGIGAA